MAQVPDPFEEAQGLPLSEKLVHPFWKVRCFAFEELERKCFEALDGNAKIFNTTVPLLKKILEDKNVIAREKGLSAVLVWTERYDQAKRHTIAIAPSVIESLGGRSKTREICEKLILLFMEIDSLDPFIVALIEGADSKVPKVASGSIFLIKEALNIFGARVFPTKKVLPALLPWFDHSNPGVRQEAAELAKEMYRWLGNVMRKHTESLRESQVKELSQAFDQTPQEPPVPKKYLRSQLEQLEQMTSAPSKVVEIDPYELMDGLDVLPQIKNTFFELLVSKKWQERKEQTDFLLKLLDTTKIKNGDFAPLVRVLKKGLSDCNVRVVEDIVRCIGLLARGLRKEFTVYVKTNGLVAALFEKFQEKKAPVVVALHETLGLMHPHCFTMVDIMGEIMEASKNKAPHSKQQLVVFVIKLMKETQKAIFAKCIKGLCTVLLLMMDDSDPKVREIAYEAFGEIIGIAGERPIQGFLNQLDAIKQKKVREKIPTGSLTPLIPFLTSELPPISLESLPPVSVKVKETAPEKSEPKLKDPEIRETSSRRIQNTSNQGRTNKPVVPPPSRGNPGTTNQGGSKKVLGRAVSHQRLASDNGKQSKEGARDSGSSTNRNVVRSTSQEVVCSNSISMLMIQSDAIARAAEFVEESVLEQLRDSQWKLRLEGVAELTKVIEGMDDADLGRNTEAIVALLQYYPSFSESIVQILEKMFNLLMHILTTSPQFSTQVASAIIEGLVEKIHVAKLKSTMSQILSEIAERHSLQFVFTQIYRITTNQKNTKSVSEFLDYMTTALPEFGTTGLDIQQLIIFCKKSLESTNPAVKKSGVALVCELCKYLGREGLNDLLGDLKPTLMSALNKELDRIGDVKPGIPKRSQNGLGASSVAVSSGSSTGSGREGVSSRVDISTQITPKLLESLNSPNWNQRQQALTDINQIIQTANKSIQPKLGDLIPALKARLTDSNKKIVFQTLALLGEIISSVGPSFETHLKTIAPVLLKTFSDSQATSRVVSCLDIIISEIGSMDPLVVYLPEAMSILTSRKELLQWTLTYVPNHFKHNSDLRLLIKPTLSCLNDKSQEVRKLSEGLLVFLAERLDKKEIDKEIAFLQPGVANLVNSIISRSGTMVRQGSDGGQNGVGRRGGQMKRESSKKQEETPGVSESTEPIFRNSLKEVREKANQQYPWPQGQTQPGHVNQLREQMKGCIGTELHAKLFSPDVKRWVGGLEDLKTLLSPHKEAIIDNLDIILKWTTWKLCETSAHAEKVFMFLADLLQTVLDSKYKASDYEASVFLGIFLERSGNTSGKTRLMVSDILKMFLKIYPASKLMKYLLGSLKSDIVNVRLFCIYEISSLVNQQGAQVCSFSDLPSIAQCLSDCDASVQSAVLGLFNLFYCSLGEEIWSYIPDISPVQKLMIQKKYMESRQSLVSNAKSKIPTLTHNKTVQMGVVEGGAAVLVSQSKISFENDNTMIPTGPTETVKSSVVKIDPPVPVITEETKPQVKSSTSKTDPPVLPKETKVPVANTDPLVPVISEKTKPPIIPSHSQNSPNQEQKIYEPNPLPPSSTDFELDLDSLLPPNTTTSETIPIPFPPIDPCPGETPQLPTRQCSRFNTTSTLIESWSQQLKTAVPKTQVQVFHTIINYVKENETTLVPHVDELVDFLIEELEDMFSRGTLTGRLCKYLVKTLMTVFERRNLVIGISEMSFLASLKSLSGRLFDSRVVELEEGEAIRNAFNHLLLKILANSDISLLVLLNELRDSIPPFSPDNASKPHTKYISLLTKCLITLKKNLPSTITRMDIPRILHSMHLFLTRHPPSSWKDREPTPLNAVLHIHSDLVKIKQKDILQCFTLVAVNTKPPPAVLLYTLGILGKLFPNDDFSVSSVTGVETSTGEDVRNREPNVEELIKQSPYVNTGELSSKEEIKKTIGIIFKKIATKSEQGLADLVVLLHNNPKIDIDHYIRCTHTQFQQLVEVGLKKYSEINVHDVLKSIQKTTVPVNNDKENIGIQKTTMPVNNDKENIEPNRIIHPTTKGNPDFPKLSVVTESHPPPNVKLSNSTSTPTVLSSDTSDASDIASLRARLQALHQNVPVQDSLPPVSVMMASLEIPLSSVSAQASSSSVASLRERLAAIKKEY